MVSIHELEILDMLSKCYQIEIDNYLRTNCSYGKKYTKITYLGNRPIFSFNGYEIDAIFMTYKQNGYEIIVENDAVIIKWEDN